jgi:bifunctional DNA-binding transcriptional regulator/antitoxin component of YhaV-PrlF toxin-antitoxin module
VILPKAIRQQRRCDAGTRLVVEDTPEGVLLRPVGLFPAMKPKDVFASLPYAGKPKSLDDMEAGIAIAKRSAARPPYLFGAQVHLVVMVGKAQERLGHKFSLSGKSAKTCQGPPAKIFLYACRANQRYQLAPSRPARGALAIVMNVDRAAMDAAARETNALKRTAKSCGPDTATLVSSS